MSREREQDAREYVRERHGETGRVLGAEKTEAGARATQSAPNRHDFARLRAASWRFCFVCGCGGQRPTGADDGASNTLHVPAGLVVDRGNSPAEASASGGLWPWEARAHDRALPRLGVDLEPTVDRCHAVCEAA